MHTLTSRSRWLRFALSIMFAGVLLAILGAPAAHAGVATVRQCRGAGADLIDGGTNGGFINFTGCADGGEASLESSGGAGAQAPIAFRNMTVSAPGSTSFVGGRLYRQMHNYLWYTGSGAPSWAFGYALTSDDGTTLESCGFSGINAGNCFTNTAYHTVFPSDYKDLPVAPMRTFTLTVGCARVGACHHWYGNPGVDGIAADLLVRDDVAPSPTAVSGPLATADVIHAGETDATLGATDTNGLGVYDARLLVDNEVVKSEVFTDYGGRCVDADPGAGVTWLSGQPCPADAAVRPFSFDALPEGHHNIKVQVRDAALNETLALNRDVTVDLIAAPTSTAAPTIAGTPRTGKTLVADPGTWDGHGRSVTFSYRWLRCDTAGNNCVETGARTAAHDVDFGDAYHVLLAEVTATSDQGTTVARSAPTAVVHDIFDHTTPPSQSTGQDPAAKAGQQPGSADGGRGAANGDNPSDVAKLEAYFSANGKRVLRTAYGRRAVLRGKLTGPSGAGISNARIELLSRLAVPRAAMVDKGGARTRKDGTWTLILPRDVSSRTLTLRYRSHARDTRAAAEATLKLSVKSGLTLKITPRRTHNHGTIHFAAKVLGHSVPRKGKVVELQARGKGHTRWITFKTVRSSKGGSVRASYTFHASSSVSYQFRARARTESGYPYLTGVSRRVTIRVS